MEREWENIVGEWLLQSSTKDCLSQSCRSQSCFRNKWTDMLHQAMANTNHLENIWKIISGSWPHLLPTGVAFLSGTHALAV